MSGGSEGEWYELSDGDKGIEETVALMAQMTRASLGDRAVKQVAIMATQAVPKTDPAAYAAEIFKFAKKVFRFVPDTAAVEELTSPTIHSKRVLETGKTYGDCDDYAMAQAAWLMAVGVPARFTVIASPRHKGIFDHVRVEARLPTGWTPMETTIKRSAFGQSFPAVRAKSWDV